jgi:hypothetical protein
MALVLQDITVVKPDLLCIELFSEPLTNYPIVTVSPPTGDAITDVQTNAAGGFRITTTNATSYAGMRSIKGVTDNGSGLFRIEVYSTTGMSNGNSVTINGVQGIANLSAVNGTRVVSNVTATTFDLVGSTYVSGYTFGGYCTIYDNANWGATSVAWDYQTLLRFHVRGVAGDLGQQLNDQNWYGALWSATEIDIVHIPPYNPRFGGTRYYECNTVYQKEHAYTSGGTISRYHNGSGETATNPYTGLSATAQRIGRDNNRLKFQPPSPTTLVHLDRDAADDVASYPTVGGRTVTAVYRTSQPWDAIQAPISGSYNIQMRHRLFLQLDGDLTQGTYSWDLSAIDLGTVEFVWNDKITRCYGFAASQEGYRPVDPY